MLVLFGLKKKFYLNLSIVQLQGSDVNGRLKVVLIVPATNELLQVGTVSDGKMKKKELGFRASTKYAEGMVISVKKENLRHCRPLKY